MQRYSHDPVRFVHFLGNPSNQTYSFIGPSIYVDYLPLVISLFLKVSISFNYYKYVIVPGIFYGTWNSPLGNFFANKYGYTINKGWRQEVPSFRLQKRN